MMVSSSAAVFKVKGRTPDDFLVFNKAVEYYGTIALDLEKGEKSRLKYFTMFEKIMTKKDLQKHGEARFLYAIAISGRRGGFVICFSS